MRTFTFNGTKSDVYFWTNSIEQDVLPPVSFDSINIAGRHGAIPLKSRLGVRTHKIKVTLLAASDTDMRSKNRDIAKWLFTDTERTLTFSDEPDKSYQSKLTDQTALTQLLTIGETVLTFTASDPFAYGAVKSQTVATGGTVTNTGTAPAYPIVTFAPSATITNFTVTNSTTGRSVNLTGTFTGGQTYELNMATDTLINKNTGNRIMTQISVNSDFWDLQAGSNAIAFTNSASVTVTVQYTEKFY